MLSFSLFPAVALLLVGASTSSLAGELPLVRRSPARHALELPRPLMERSHIEPRRMAKKKHPHHRKGTEANALPVAAKGTANKSKKPQHGKAKPKSPAKPKSKPRKGRTANATHTSTGGKKNTTSPFAKSALAQHNLYRKQYGANPLTWSPSLATAASKWAAKCDWAHSGGTVGPYGENIAAGQSTIQGVVDAWVNGPSESASYNPTNPVASHFTQVVWKGSKKVGCAQVTCPGIANLPQANPIFWVCEYSPPGNVFPASNFLANVGSKK